MPEMIWMLSLSRSRGWRARFDWRMNLRRPSHRKVSLPDLQSELVRSSAPVTVDDCGLPLGRSPIRVRERVGERESGRERVGESERVRERESAGRLALAQRIQHALTHSHLQQLVCFVAGGLHDRYLTSHWIRIKKEGVSPRQTPNESKSVMRHGHTKRDRERESTS